MSVAEILEELPRLAPLEREAVWRRMEEIEFESFEETPAMLTFIDEGVASAENEPLHSIESVRAEIPSWITKSS